MLLLAAGCATDAGSPLEPAPEASRTILDAGHNGNVPGFYFLPPMVKGATFAGTFDADLSPRVVICELSGAVCGATLVEFTTAGSGSERVRVDAQENAYIVNWHTGRFSLDAAKFYRISVYQGSFLLGYADVDPVSKGGDLKNVDETRFVALKIGQTLPIKFRVERGIAAAVDVSPDSALVEPGQTQQFTATVTDLHGNVIPGAPVAWSSSAPAVATVDANGLATGVAPGTASITASSGAASDAATLVVQVQNTPPTANGDAFEAIGNVTVPVSAPGVLANDTDPEGNALQAVAGSRPTAAGGTVVLQADGSFTYLSAPGFTGEDSFTYQATDGTAQSAAATVTISVASRVWYVRNNAAAPGDGRDASSFVTLAQAEAASAPGEMILVMAGDGTSAGMDQGITLKTGQSLNGQGVAAPVAVTLNGESVTLLAPGAAPRISNSGAGATIRLAAGNTVQGIDVSSSAGAGISGNGFGLLAVSRVNVEAAGGPALDLQNGNASAVFGTLSSAGSAGAGLRLVNVGGSVAASSGSLSGAAGAGVEITGGDAAVTYPGDISFAAARAVSITGRTGGAVTLSGSIQDTGLGIRVQGSTGGSVAFTGSSKSLSTGANTAVTLSGNTGAAVSFAGGGLAIATTTGNGFDATGGGTVTVTGADNTIASAGGVALSVRNTEIGAAGLSFRRIDANGGSNGIVLVNTGAANGVQVTGDGATLGSGGTIQGMTGADGSSAGTGVYLDGVRNVRLNFVRLLDFENFAVRGSAVGGFVLNGSAVGGSNGTSAALAEGSLSFTGLTGSATISSSAVSGGLLNNLRVVNAAGTLDRISLLGTTFGSNGAADGADGVYLEAGGAAVMNVTVQGSQFTSARTNLFNLNLLGNAHADLAFSGNTLANGHPAILSGAGGMVVSGGGVGSNPQLSYDIANNTFRGALGAALSVSKGAGAGSFSGSITGNVIGQAGVANSGSAQGSGINVAHLGGGTSTVAVTGNQVRQYNNFGINVSAGTASAGGNGTLNATVTGNTVTEPGTAAFPMNGINVNVGNSSGDAHAVCASITGNAAAGSGAFGGTDIRIRQRFLTTTRLPGYAGGNADNAAVAAFLEANNAGSPTVQAQNSVATGGGGFVGGGACPQP
jgi:hypothetical protein